MKIAFFVSQFPSISQTFVLNQITGLLDRGHEVDIFARRPGAVSKVHEDVVEYDLLKRTHYFSSIPKNRFLRAIKGLALIGRYASRKPAIIANSLNILKHGMESASLVLLFQAIPFLNKNAFDVIYCHFGPNGAMAVKLREAGVISGKIVTVFHGYDLTSYLAKNGKKIYNDLFEKGDLFQPISKRWESKLIELGCSRERISVHRMGIDIDKIEFSKRSDTDGGCIKLLSIARLVEKKGIEFGIQAVSKLIKQFPDTEYCIVGDGPLKSDLSSLIDRLQMNHKIKMMGWMNQAEIFAFMQQSDILLAPSVTGQSGDQEGIPVVLMEAMAHGLPVVSTRHSGIPELVIDNQTGFLVEERDTEGLTEKIALLISNPEMRRKFADDARNRVARNFNSRLLNDDLMMTFCKLAN